MKYEKTKADEQKEKDDLVTSPIMRFLQRQEDFRFNIGDVLIKQRKMWGLPDEDKWETETNRIGGPIKYMYVFENKLGIGYLKRLKVDGTGLASSLICTVNLDPEATRFQLDPEYADHLMLADEDEKFEYNKIYKVNKEFRNEAIIKNRKLLVGGTGSHKKVVEWFKDLKKGDVFWHGHSYDDLISHKYEVTNITGKKLSTMTNWEISGSIDQWKPFLKDGMWYSVTAKNVGSKGYSYEDSFTLDSFLWRKTTSKEPFPLKDEMCVQAK